MKKIFILVITILFLSCNTKTDETTYIFSKYLNSTFEINIPDKQHYYVLLPQLVCKGCVQQSQIYLNDFLENNPAQIENISFIYSNDETANHDLIEKLHSYFDNDGKIDQLPGILGIGNLTIISTNKRKIQQRIVINHDNFTKIDELFKGE